MEDSKIQKCLNFNLMIEYVAKNTQNKEYQLIGVYPPKIDSIQSQHRTVIEVKFDKELEIDDISKICFLQNKEKLDQVLLPEKIIRNG